MTTALWIISGICLGILLGSIITLAWVKEKLIAYYQDMEIHRHAAMEMSKKLAESRRENEQLTEQVDRLLREIDQPYPSEAWKEQA